MTEPPSESRTCPDGDIGQLVLAVEKVVRLLKENEERTQLLENRVVHLEQRIESICFDVHAPEDMDAYMQAVKNDTGPERPMTGEDIKRRTEELYARRSKK